MLTVAQTQGPGLLAGARAGRCISVTRRSSAIPSAFRPGNEQAADLSARIKDEGYFQIAP